MSRQVAQRASAQSGVGADLLKQMLPVVAAMVMGAMAKKQTPAPARRRAASVRHSAARAEAGGILDMLAPMLDSNRDGSAVDDDHRDDREVHGRALSAGM